MTTAITRRLRRAATRWCAGWSCLFTDGDAAGDAGLGLPQRLALNARAAGWALRTGSFWGLLGILVAMTLLWHVAVWELDLRGWRRDLPGAVLVMLMAPWVACARRRHVRILIARAGGRRICES